MVIPQAGLSSDLLPTVTAFISALPNLGGVLGVGIVGTVINSKFRSSVAALGLPGYTLAHINDAVKASQDPVAGPRIAAAYVGAFQLGYRILTGVAVLQFVLCLGLARVVLQGKHEAAEQTELATVDVKDKGDFSEFPVTDDAIKT